MRHQKRTRTLDRKRGPRTALIRSLGISLIRHGFLQTTPTKARVVQGFIEPLVRLAKEPTVAHHRRIASRLGEEKKSTQILLKTIAPKFATRQSGFTRRIKIPPRKGDGAEQVRLEWTE